MVTLRAPSQSKLACTEPLLAQLNSFLSLTFLLCAEEIHTTAAGWTEGGDDCKKVAGVQSGKVQIWCENVQEVRRRETKR